LNKQSNDELAVELYLLVAKQAEHGESITVMAQKNSRCTSDNFFALLACDLSYAESRNRYSKIAQEFLIAHASFVKRLQLQAAVDLSRIDS
jgi:hypothetical protein